jgi:1,4-dihydroxy-2-naphthoate octaprenyltransferase
MGTILNGLIAPMRPSFLLIPPSAVALGAGTALWTGFEINLLFLLLAFIGAMAAHASVNALNSYLDFRSGLDLRTDPTPFSGGSHGLRDQPEAAHLALVGGLGTLAIAVLIGLYFVTVWGSGLLPLGLLGVFLVVAYTPWITRLPAISLIAPGLGFGTCMVLGTYFVLTGTYSWPAFFASLVPFWLINLMLIINQFPDMEADWSVGRRNYVIILGPKRASLIYGAMVWATYLSIVVGWALGQLPLGALLGLLTFPLAVQITLGAYRHADDMESLIPVMAKNVQFCLITPALMAVGIFLSVWLG